MTYMENGDTVTLEMTRGDYDFLLLQLGAAAGRASCDENKAVFWEFIRFINRMNETDPRFKPYPIPPEFDHADRA